MAESSVEVLGGAALLRSLEAFQKKLEKEAKQGLMAAALKVQSQAKQNLTDDGTVHMGRLRSSIRVRKAGDGTYVDVYTNVQYAAAVEFGSRPHFPPIAPLSDWSKKKLGTDLGYVIARKISREGTPAKPYLFPALEAERPNFPEDVAAAAKAVFR